MRACVRARVCVCVCVCISVDGMVGTYWWILSMIAAYYLRIWDILALRIDPKRHVVLWCFLVTPHRRCPTRPMQNNSDDSRPRSFEQIHALKWSREILAQLWLVSVRQR